MSNLIVLDFDGIHTADEVLNKLRSLQKEYLIDLEDACVVERDKAGKVFVKQAVNLTALGAARGGSMGALWGTLVGLLLLGKIFQSRAVCGRAISLHSNPGIPFIGPLEHPSLTS
jgi:uncharacterized membrane protein